MKMIFIACVLGLTVGAGVGAEKGMHGYSHERIYAKPAAYPPALLEEYIEKRFDRKQWSQTAAVTI